MRAFLGAVVFAGFISPALAQVSLPQGAVWRSDCDCFVVPALKNVGDNWYLNTVTGNSDTTITYDVGCSIDETAPVAPIVLLKWRWWNLAGQTWNVRNSISRNLKGTVVSAKDLADDGKALQKSETELRALEAAINTLSPEKK